MMIKLIFCVPPATLPVTPARFIVIFNVYHATQLSLELYKTENAFAMNNFSIECSKNKIQFAKNPVNPGIMMMGFNLYANQNAT